MVEKKLDLKDWIKAFDRLDKPPKINTIKKLFYNHEGKESSLNQIIHEKTIDEFINRPCYNYTFKYYKEINKFKNLGTTLSFQSAGISEILNWERNNENNLYLKIVFKQENIEKFILGDMDSKNDGRFIYIKRATDNSFYDFMKLIYNFIPEYIKVLEFRKHLKGRTNKEREEYLNSVIDLINEISYIKNKDREKIEYINLKDLKDLKKILLENIKQLDIEFFKDPFNLSKFISEIINIIEEEK